jgi:hypothetical protein
MEPSTGGENNKKILFSFSEKIVSNFLNYLKNNMKNY